MLKWISFTIGLFFDGKCVFVKVPATIRSMFLVFNTYVFLLVASICQGEVPSCRFVTFLSLILFSLYGDFHLASELPVQPIRSVGKTLWPIVRLNWSNICFHSEVSLFVFERFKINIRMKFVVSFYRWNFTMFCLSKISDSVTFLDEIFSKNLIEEIQTKNLSIEIFNGTKVLLNESVRNLTVEPVETIEEFPSLICGTSTCSMEKINWIVLLIAAVLLLISMGVTFSIQTILTIRQGEISLKKCFSKKRCSTRF